MNTKEQIALYFWADGVGGAQHQGRLLQNSLKALGYKCDIYFVTTNSVKAGNRYLGLILRRISQLKNLCLIFLNASRYQHKFYYLHSAIKLGELIKRFEKNKTRHVFMARNFPVEEDFVERVSKFDQVMTNDQMTLNFLKDHQVNAAFLPNIKKRLKKDAQTSRQKSLSYVIFSRLVGDKNILGSIKFCLEKKFEKIEVSGSLSDDPEYAGRVLEMVDACQSCEFKNIKFPSENSNEVLVLLSKREGESNVLVDFLNCGKLAIVNKRSDPNGLVSSGKNGVNIDDNNDFEEMLQSAFNTDKSERMNITRRKILDQYKLALEMHVGFLNEHLRSEMIKYDG